MALLMFSPKRTFKNFFRSDHFVPLSHVMRVA